MVKGDVIRLNLLLSRRSRTSLVAAQDYVLNNSGPAMAALLPLLAVNKQQWQ